MKNNLNDIPFFYFPGGINYDKLNFAQKSLLKMYKSSLEKKKNKTIEEKGIHNALSNSFDGTDQKYIEPLIIKCIELT